MPNPINGPDSAFTHETHSSYAAAGTHWRSMRGFTTTSRALIQVNMGGSSRYRPRLKIRTATMMALFRATQTYRQTLKAYPVECAYGVWL